MQQCQDQLQFQIETPSDQELARRFADRQKELTERLASLTEESETVHGFKKPPSFKPRNRKSKQQKKQERLNRAKTTECQGCDQSGGK